MGEPLNSPFKLWDFSNKLFGSSILSKRVKAVSPAILSTFQELDYLFEKSEEEELGNVFEMVGITVHS